MTFFNPIKENEINLLGEGLNIRNDCQAGMWKINTEPLTKKPISIVILETDTLTGSFYPDAEPTLWKQIFFVAAPKEKEIPQNIVCYTVIKTESLSNFEQAIILAQVNYKSMFDFIVECSFESRSCKSGEAKGEQYYVVNFEIRARDTEEKKQVKQLKDFLNTNPKFSNDELKERFSSVAQEKAYLEGVDTKYLEADISQNHDVGALSEIH
jgi:hypothetical protein